MLKPGARLLSPAPLPQPHAVPFLIRAGAAPVATRQAFRQLLSRLCRDRERQGR